MGFLTGKQKSSSVSENTAFPFIKEQFGGAAGFAGDAGNIIKALLGMGGDPSGFDKYKESAGYQHVLDSGSRAITGNAAARGLLRGGSTGKALVNYGQDVGKSFLDNYLSHAMGLGQLGLGAGGLITQAGQRQTSESQSKKGLGGLIGSIASGVAASDKRLKKNIERLDEVSGLGLYKFEYIDGRGPYVGVMADEVASLYPEALGPSVDGYLTVDYDKLSEVVDGLVD